MSFLSMILQNSLSETKLVLVQKARLHFLLPVVNLAFSPIYAFCTFSHIWKLILNPVPSVRFACVSPR